MRGTNELEMGLTTVAAGAGGGGGAAGGAGGGLALLAFAGLITISGTLEAAAANGGDGDELGDRTRRAGVCRSVDCRA